MKRTALLGFALLLTASWGCGGKTNHRDWTGRRKGYREPEGRQRRSHGAGEGRRKGHLFLRPLGRAARGLSQRRAAVSGRHGHHERQGGQEHDRGAQERRRRASKIHGFYEGKLKENGWEIETTANIGEGSMFAAKKEKRQLSVVINAENISIGVQKE